jgi:hypothetical protein
MIYWIKLTIDRLQLSKHFSRRTWIKLQAAKGAQNATTVKHFSLKSKIKLKAETLADLRLNERRLGLAFAGSVWHLKNVLQSDRVLSCQLTDFNPKFDSNAELKSSQKFSWLTPLMSLIKIKIKRPNFHSRVWRQLSPLSVLKL